MAALLVAIVGGFVTYLAIQIERGETPDNMVLFANELKPPVKLAIELAITLDVGESVEFYYSSALLDHHADMNIVTNKRVISYQDVEGDIQLTQARYQDIKEVEIVVEGSFSMDTVVYITLHEGTPSSFRLLLSVEGNRDQRAYEYLRNRVAEFR